MIPRNIQDCHQVNINLGCSLSCHYTKWFLWKLGIQNALLHGTVTKTVHMKQSPDFVDPQRLNHVCFLHKCIYGLKHDHRVPKSLPISSCSQIQGSKVDPSLFIYPHLGTLLYILIHVDNIIITENNNVSINEVALNLGKPFLLINLGQLNYFLVYMIPNRHHLPCQPCLCNLQPYPLQSN